MNHRLQVLKDNGYKITKPRERILSMLEGRLLSAQEVTSQLRNSHADVDLVTAYRTLELFTELGIVRTVHFQDKITRYELDSTDHHHHTVCRKCHTVKAVHLDEAPLIEEASTKANFTVESHAMEFFGICGSCR